MIPFGAFAGGCCFTPSGGELRKSRTMFLCRVNRRIPKSNYLTLPCSSIALALLETPHSRSVAHFWETVGNEEADEEGVLVLALSSERDAKSITHLLVWRLERFWLHVLKVENVKDEKGATRGKVTRHIHRPLNVQRSLGFILKVWRL
jgi:hypothetical protein